LELIVNNLKDPSWWFTGIFFAVFALALPKVFKKFLKVIRIYARNSRLKTLRKIRSLSHDAMMIQYEISKNSAYFMLFIMTVFVLFLALLLSPLASGIRNNHTLFVVSLSPVLFFEVLWLSQNSYVKELIKARRKLVTFSHVTHSEF